MTAFHEDGDEVCRECIRYLGGRNPQQFPTIEEFHDALQLYPEPLFASDDELEAAECAARADGTAGKWEDPIAVAAEITLER